MRLRKSWIITSKDFKTFRRKRNVIYSTIIFPLVAAILLPLVIEFAGRNTGGIPAAALPDLLDAFAFFFVIGAATLPTAIASYSIVGEKVEKSLEPLLATPTTDGEILLGKIVAAFLPSVLAIYAGASIFMALIDRITYGQLGYLYFPNPRMEVILLLIVPLASMLCVELNVILSARVSDVRAVQQLGGLAVLPFAGIYVAGEIGLVSLTTDNLLLVAAVLTAIDLVLFYLSTVTFRREEILTKWK
jgi:ABC-2 type transport system permease protein